MPYKVFVNGFPLNASELNTFVMPQTISTFADATARNGAIENPVEGQFAFLTATDELTYYTGSAWSVFGQPAGTVVTEKSANYTIVAGDSNSYIYVSAAATITIDDVLAVGDSINFIQSGTGQITFAGGSGVTIYSKDSKLKTNKQYSAATITKKTTGQYFLVGDLAA